MIRIIILAALTLALMCADVFFGEYYRETHMATRHLNT